MISETVAEKPHKQAGATRPDGFSTHVRKSGGGYGRYQRAIAAGGLEEHLGVMEQQDSPPFALRLAVLAVLYSLGLLGLFAALNWLVH